MALLRRVSECPSSRSVPRLSEWICGRCSCCDKEVVLAPRHSSFGSCTSWSRRSVCFVLAACPLQAKLFCAGSMFLAGKAVCMLTEQAKTRRCTVSAAGPEQRMLLLSTAVLHFNCFATAGCQPTAVCVLLLMAWSHQAVVFCCPCCVAAGPMHQTSRQHRACWLQL
jgi:hypothetical protein